MIRPFENLTPNVADSAYIDPQAVVIGDVTVGEQASIFPMAVARGDIHRIEIGARTNVQDGSILHVTHDSAYCPGGLPLIIGEDVTVGHQVTLHACTIGHHCLIGMGSVVLDGAVLEPYVLLGAGSLVSPHKTLEGGFLWRGSPAKKIRPLTEKEMQYFEYSAQNYVKLAQRYKN
ncbi:gamma carbonic anhydrase family protein [Candidatus Albibeggiatoa sp. nov. NOAA]|uniref:gamma carbonic anhydrase family protein n=1 Tax=Candidatus Albibeggiatoa sp. nov. NOAA TaxID=3162724 RepID=UPI0032FACD8E|nr:gamma carbonic anhydrase family protein [Thiotrichaceae bacterium]